MEILISGGSGFLGQALSHALSQHQENHQITWLTRNPQQAHPSYVSLMSYDELKSSQQSYDVIINLAGAGIADKRWSDGRKQTLYQSRLQPTQAILDYIQKCQQQDLALPKFLISGSAIGWYGAMGQTVCDETTTIADIGTHQKEFTHQLCQKWEQLALTAQQFGVPVAIIRTGVVLDKKGGILSQLLTPFKLGLGGRLGDGQQMMSWISRLDWVRAVQFIIKQHLSTSHLSSKHRASNTNQEVGARVQIYNLTAPHAVSNQAFTKALGQWLNRPTWFCVPKFVLSILLGEMSTLLVDGQTVYPFVLLEQGFEFQHNELKQAFENSYVC